jgi:TatD DNase family protein
MYNKIGFIMQLIDSHCHIDAQDFISCKERVISEAREHGITRMIVPGITASGWNQILKLSEFHKEIFAAPGLHPLFLSDHKEKDLIQLKQLTHNPRVIALGEIGLDYYHKDTDQKGQQELFVKQLDIASEAKSPVLLHVRKAHDQVLSLLRKKQFTEGGIVHSFSGSLQQAEQYINLGFCIGVGGTITYTGAKRRHKVIAALPTTAIVLETDSPYMALSGHSGKPNEPKQLRKILKSLAVLRKEEELQVGEYTTRNCERCLKLSRIT